MSYNQYWQGHFPAQDLEIQNSLQIIIPEEDYELYDDMPGLVSDDIPDNEWAMPGDDDWMGDWVGDLSIPSPNSQVP